MSNNDDNNISETAQSMDREDERETPSPTVPRPLVQTEDANLEDAFSKLFKSSVSGTGEEELLRIASDYALQINAHQIKLLLYLEHRASQYRQMAALPQFKAKAAWYEWQANYLTTFVFRWLDLKRHNNSDVFVMRGLDSISLRKFINENTLKVNIEK